MVAFAVKSQTVNSASRVLPGLLFKSDILRLQTPDLEFPVCPSSTLTTMSPPAKGRVLLAYSGGLGKLICMGEILVKYQDLQTLHASWRG